MPLIEDSTVPPVLDEKQFVRAVQAVYNSSWRSASIVVHPKTVTNARDNGWLSFQAATRCLEERARMRRWHWIARKRSLIAAERLCATSQALWKLFGYGKCTYI